MEANPRTLERIFDKAISYHIPLFQRPYVWSENENWKPLWADIEMLLDQQLITDKTHPHFLGAVVFEQLKNATGSIEERQVIDGQQRLITLQLFLIAILDLCAEHGDVKYVDRFTDLVSNKESRIDRDTERYKVWPTNCDREDFAATRNAGSPAALLAMHEAVGKRRVGNRIPDAYLFFSEKLNHWFNSELQDDDDFVDIAREDRLEALWQVARAKLQVVVIDLDDDDDSQIIFETLNARGTQLLPADLVKNFLFRRAQNADEPVQELYDKYWKNFDVDFWRKEIRHGRLKRPRIDIFLQHYLSLKILDDVRVTHLFNTFKQFVEPSLVTAEDETQSELSSGDHLESLNIYGQQFRTFFEPQPGSTLAIFLERLAAVDTTTVYPFLLEACQSLSSHNSAKLDRILVWMESFLIRRMICGLTMKNYNKLFIALVKESVVDGRVDEDKVVQFLLKGDGDTNRFPDDAAFMTAWMANPLYQRLAQYKVKALLIALDNEFAHAKSERLSLPSNLTIEHVMPQQWEEHWPLHIDDPIGKQDASELRNQKVHTIGNLTLITGSLNPALSNRAWVDKRPEIAKFSKLNLNRYFHDKDKWSEVEITERGEILLAAALKIWPYPKPF